jgi:prevent-host-death family protein
METFAEAADVRPTTRSPTRSPGVLAAQAESGTWRLCGALDLLLSALPAGGYDRYLTTRRGRRQPRPIEIQIRLWYCFSMKTVSIDELKRHLSSLVDQAAAGARILITKHRRPVASLAAADMEHVHVGARFGRGALKPLLRAPTQGQYLEVLASDRRPAGGHG